MSFISADDLAKVAGSVTTRVLAIGGRIVLVLLATCGLLWPLAGSVPSSPPGAPYDPVVIIEMRSEFEVDAEGTMAVTERITADFPGNRHGIFRYWDVTDPNDPGVRYVPTIGRITVDGVDAQFSTFWQGGDRFLVAKIGNPQVYLSPGPHRYTIGYTIGGVISSPTAGAGARFASSEGDSGSSGSVFYWNVVAPGWEMPIRRARITIKLPSPSGQVQCSAGTAGGAGPCGIVGAGSADLLLNAQDIPARTGMTVRAGMEAPAPRRQGLPWSVRWDPVLGRSLALFTAVIVASAAALVTGVALGRRGREDPPGFPIQYEPPPGLGPVQTVYMASESQGPAPLVATILHLADRGVVSLENPTPGTWRIVGRVPEEQWDQLDPAAQLVGRSLRVRRAGATFAADESASAGTVLGDAGRALKSVVEDWATTAGLVRADPRVQLARVIWGVAILLAVLGFSGWHWPTMWGLPFAALAIGAVTVLAAGTSRRRTAEGRAVWSKAGGFERLLSTPAAEDRFDFAARKDLFTAYVPYAVAFGVADRWAEKYQITTQSPPPIPDWYPYFVPPYAQEFTIRTFYSGHAEHTLDAAISNSISAYTAARSTSMTSGGRDRSSDTGWGGSDSGAGLGGGGGGGGGGSW